MKKGILYKVSSLISPGYRKRGMRTLILLLLGSVLDLFTLATFLPLIVIIIKPEELSANIYLAKLYDWSAMKGAVQFGVALAAFAMLLIAVKTFINVWITRQKATFAYEVAHNLSMNLFDKYTRLGFTEFTTVDYAATLNRLTNLPLIFANNILIPAGTMLSEGIIAIVLFGAVCYYDPMLFLFLMLLGVPAYLLYRTRRSAISGTSEQIKTQYPLLLKYALQNIEGLVEIKTFQKESFFKNRIRTVSSRLADVFAADHTRHTTVSRTTELLAALLVGMSVIYILWTNASKEQAMMLLSVYATASFRCVPSLNRIFGAYMQIRTHEYVIHELNAAPDANESRDDGLPLPFKEKVELQKVSFGYTAERHVLHDLNLVIRKGEKIIVSGKSGNGKTTLLLLLLQLVHQWNGDILIDGQRINKSNAKTAQRLFAYVPQSPYILDGTISENVAFGVPADLIDQKKVHQLLHDLDLSSWVDSLPAGADTVIGEKGTKISGGQQQRIAVARALYLEREVLLLDEVTNQLDQQSESEVVTVLQNLTLQHKTVLLITHRTELRPLFDAVYELKEGSLQRVDVHALATE